MTETIVLGGSLSLDFVSSGELDLNHVQSGQGDLAIFRNEVPYPTYAGPLEVTPSAEAQTLETSMKTVTDNIVINPVPNNYGLITWDGSTLTVS